MKPRTLRTLRKIKRRTAKCFTFFALFAAVFGVGGFVAWLVRHNSLARTLALSATVYAYCRIITDIDLSDPFDPRDLLDD